MDPLLLTDNEPLLLASGEPLLLLAGAFAWPHQRAAGSATYPPPATLAYARVPGPPYDPERTMPVGWVAATPYRPGAAA